MPVNLASSSLPATLLGVVSVNPFGVPRFWATIGDIDLINEIIAAAPASLERHTALRFDEN